MRILSGVHLGYCTNVHAGETLSEVTNALSTISTRVRSHLGVETLGLGLYLSAHAAKEADPVRLRDTLESLGLYAFTVNGFPFGGFHDDCVKEAVYTPTWAEPPRLEHTVRLARLLAHLAPSDVLEPSISTLPLGYLETWNAGAGEASLRALVRLALELDALAQASGRRVRVCLEPEPGCVLETMGEVAEFFARLRRAAGTDATYVDQHLGVCYDTCHHAVTFEEPRQVVATLRDAGVAIGKVQLSSALELQTPADPTARALLLDFDEPRYLHQVRTKNGFGVDDLPRAFSELKDTSPWRIHFHVPIDRNFSGPLVSTQPVLKEAIAALAEVPNVTQFEVETYTWSVLPEAERPEGPEALARGLMREVEWAKKALENR